MTKYSAIIVRASIAALLAQFAIASIRADIYEWEYINPSDQGLGKQPSTTLTPDGAGAETVPGANLSNRNLTKAYLIGADLSPSVAYDEYGYISGYGRANLTSATLTQADLSNTRVNAATMTGANLAGADIRGANFDRYDQYGYSAAYGYGTGITVSQLASTASFAAHDLAGVSLGMHNLTGVDFTGFKLTGSRFADANLTNVKFNGADLTGATVSGTLTGANFSDAEVGGASLSGVSKAQLYSTASYQANDLSGIYLYSDQTNWNFAGKNLSQAAFQSSMDLNNSTFAGADLANVELSYVSLTGVDFHQANLTGADLSWGNHAEATFAGAEVRGAKFDRAPQYPGSGISISQLASTASFQAHDLSGMRLRGNDMAGADLSGQKLADVDFVGASLAGANFTGAEVRGALFHLVHNEVHGGIAPAQLQSTASYQAHDLSGIGLGGNNLAGMDLAGQNLANASFQTEAGHGANLSGADLSHANLSNAQLGNTTLAGATLVGAYLGGLNLPLTDFTNANLREADLSFSNLAGYFIVVPGEEGGYYHFPGTNLAGANLSSADLTDANFAGTEDYVFGFPHPGANLTNANLSGADARGANFLYATLNGANTANLIQSDGHIAGLDLTGGKSLIVRDYEGFISGEGIPIVVEQQLATDESSALKLEFDADSWNSTISFAPGTPVALGGTLELAFAPDVDVAAQSGRTIDLFDWTGVAPTGAFTVSSPYAWDLSNLYTTGEVTLITPAGNISGDFNGDSMVDAADLAAWRTGFGTTGNATRWQGDADGDQDVDGGDFLVWQRQLGNVSLVSMAAQVPESATFTLFSMACCGVTILRPRRRLPRCCKHEIRR